MVLTRGRVTGRCLGLVLQSGLAVGALSAMRGGLCCFGFHLICREEECRSEECWREGWQDDAVVGV